MKVEKLNSSHKEALIPLFTNTQYMGADLKDYHSQHSVEEFKEIAYNVFSDTYLSDLKNYAAFGTIEDGMVTSVIAGYASLENPEWYWTQVRSKNALAIKYALDAAIEYHEQNGRFKFYSAFNLKYKESYRRLAFSKENQERYTYVNEFVVPAKTRCPYLTPWQVLFNRTLVPVDTVVRCAFLKPEYRPTEITIHGKL